jgi:molybdopterin converting factor subunit 1
MHITTRFFALHRDIVGTASMEMEVSDGATIADVWARLGKQYPELVPATRSLMYALNQEYADPEAALHDGDEVAFIPPVSGGEDTGFRPFVVTEQPLHVDALSRYVQTAADGAIVVFSGVARDNFNGRATEHLFYDAYPAMAEPVLASIAATAAEQWEIGRVAIHHRTGRLEIGETAVLVVVAAPHRHGAFAAAEYIMDRIKEIAPIWKRETWADGAAEWVGDEKTRT